MPTFEFELPQKDFDSLKELGNELGLTPDQALSHCVRSYFSSEEEPFDESPALAAGVPMFRSREELIAMLDEALDDDSPGRPASEVIEELRRMNSDAALRPR
jgi:hypothetical protein